MQLVRLKNAGTKSKILRKHFARLLLVKLKGEREMVKQPEELKKLVAVATDLGLSATLRTQAINLIGNIGTYDALLILLDLVANEQLTKGERELALKHAGKIIKSSR